MKNIKFIVFIYTLLFFAACNYANHQIEKTTSHSEANQELVGHKLYVASKTAVDNVTLANITPMLSKSDLRLF